MISKANNIKYLIWSIEHNAWWKYSKFGYTTYIDEAGRFTYDEATKIVEQANIVKVQECMIPETRVYE